MEWNKGKGNHLKATAKVDMIKDSVGWHKAKGTILLRITPNDESAKFQNGDILMVNSHLRIPSGEENPFQFNYRDYLLNKKITHVAYVYPSHYLKIGHKKHLLIDALGKFRSNLINTFENSSLTENHKGIAEAILLGWDENLNPETRHQFKAGGIAHLLCVSGLHVGIILILLDILLIFVGNEPWKRISKNILKILCVWGFVLLSGMGLAAQRAGLMLSCILISDCLNRKNNTINTLAFSLFLLILFNPRCILEVGVQLSYSATLGIILCTRATEDIIDWESKKYSVPINTLKWILRICIISISAQLFTAPFLLYHFHEWPSYFLISNILVTPLAPIFLGTMIVMGMVSGWDWAHHIVANLVDFELNWAERVTLWVESLPGALNSGIYFDGVLFIILIIFIAFLTYSTARRKWIFLLPCISMALLGMGHLCCMKNKLSNQWEWILYSSGKSTGMEILEGRKSFLLADSSIFKDPSLLDYSSQEILTHRMISHREISPLHEDSKSNHWMQKRNFLSIQNCRFLFIEDFSQVPMSHFPIHINYLVLNQNPYVKINELRCNIDFDTLVIASNNTFGRKQRWIQDCNELNIPCFDISSQGALSSRGLLNNKLPIKRILR